LEFLHGLATQGAVGKNSVEVDPTDSNIQLRNDLTDTELEGLGYGTVYGTDDTGQRGYKKDTGGYVGNKQVDETNIGNNKILIYKSIQDKLVYEAKPDGSGGGGAGTGFLLLPYAVWRKVLDVSFSGYVDIQLQVSNMTDFSNLIYNLDSGTNTAGWLSFSASSGTYINWAGGGEPATDIMGIIYTGALTLGKEQYARWRLYQHGTDNYGDWLPLGVV
jgi:hypothetical protein